MAYKLKRKDNNLEVHEHTEGNCAALDDVEKLIHKQAELFDIDEVYLVSEDGTRTIVDWREGSIDEGFDYTPMPEPQQEEKPKKNKLEWLKVDVALKALFTLAGLVVLYYLTAGGTYFSMLFLFAGCFTVYFFPAIVAERRLHFDGGAIFVLNLFLGWTFLGWVIALVWAFTGNVQDKR